VDWKVELGPLNFASTPVPRDRQADAVDLRLEPAALDLSFSNNGDKRHECPDDTQDAFRSGFALGRLQDYLRDRRYTLRHAQKRNEHP